MAQRNGQSVIQIVRRKSHGGEHHGGAWKVAFADFMTAMFSLFLVLWLVNQSSDVKSAIAGYFQDPLGRADEFGSSIIPGEGAQAQTPRRSLEISDVTEARRDKLQSTARRLGEEIAKSPELSELKDQIQIRMTDEGLEIELVDDAKGFFFDRGSASPNGRLSQVLSLLGRELGSLSFPVRIDGHCDAHAYSNEIGYTNWELSADRANVARKILVEHGLVATQIVEVRAFADKRPREGLDPFSPKNRRVTITMLLNGVVGNGATSAAGDSAADGGATVEDSTGAVRLSSD